MRPAPRRRRVPLLVTPLAVALALALAGCSSKPDTHFATAPAAMADVVQQVSAPGAVQAAAEADLKAPAAGRVVRLDVADGSRVRAGQVLAQLSSSQVDAAIQQSQAALGSAASLGNAVPALPTSQALGALTQVQSQLTITSAGVMSTLRALLPVVPAAQRAQVQAQLDQAQAQLAQAQLRAQQAAQQAAAQAQAQAGALRAALDGATAAQRAQAALALQLAEQQRAALTLVAPSAGTVQLGRGQAAQAAIPGADQLPAAAQQALQGLGGGSGQAGPPVRVGSQVSAGETVLTVYDVTRLGVATQVDETDMPLVRVGERAGVQLDAFPGVAFPASVSRIAVAPTSQGAAGGVTYEVDLALGRVKGAGEPRVGMTATAAIEVQRAPRTLSVPSSALVGRGTGQAVFVVERRTVHLRPVRVGVEGQDRVAVVAGLQPGELVVVRGAERLRDGQSYPGA